MSETTTVATYVELAVDLRLDGGRAELPKRATLDLPQLPSARERSTEQ